MFKRSSDFESAIFGTTADRQPPCKCSKEWVGLDSIWPVIHSASPHPETPLGEALWRQIGNTLKWRGVNPEGLKFVSFVGTAIDFRKKTDGVVYLPSAHPNFVTIDAFNIAPEDLTSLGSFWLDTFIGQVYSNLHFQSDLLRFKDGLAEYMGLVEIDSGERPVFVNPLSQDFRIYTPGQRRGEKGVRWKNHFILTPKNVKTHEEIRAFASLIAGYLISAGRLKNRPNIAMKARP